MLHYIWWCSSKSAHDYSWWFDRWWFIKRTQSSEPSKKGKSTGDIPRLELSTCQWAEDGSVKWKSGKSSLQIHHGRFLRFGDGDGTIAQVHPFIPEISRSIVRMIYLWWLSVPKIVQQWHDRTWLPLMFFRWLSGETDAFLSYVMMFNLPTELTLSKWTPLAGSRMGTNQLSILRTAPKLQRSQ